MACGVRNACQIWRGADNNLPCRIQQQCRKSLTPFWPYANPIMTPRYLVFTIVVCVKIKQIIRNNTFCMKEIYVIRQQLEFIILYIHICRNHSSQNMILLFIYLICLALPDDALKFWWEWLIYYVSTVDPQSPTARCPTIRKSDYLEL
jgi:hypothetical protein